MAIIHHQWEPRNGTHMRYTRTRMPGTLLETQVHKDPAGVAHQWDPDDIQEPLGLLVVRYIGDD